MSETTLLEDALERPVLDDLIRRGFTRRGLLRVAALVAASATLPFASEQALAQLSDAGRLPDDAVKINANEFPEGPSKRALARARRGRAAAATATSTRRPTRW